MEVKKKRVKKEHVYQDVSSPIWKFLKEIGALILAAVSISFSVYFFFKNPQLASDKNISAIQSDLATHEALQTQHEAEDLQFENDIKGQIDAIRTGDLKDVNRQLSDLAATVNTMIVQEAKLETIINERIPAKK